MINKIPVAGGTTNSMLPKEEREAEKQLIIHFAQKVGAKIIKLQEDEDDCGTDGILERNGTQICVEARRKGYPNHKGKVCFFNNGWNDPRLSKGIFLNERTIVYYKDSMFIYIVDINGYPPRYCFLSKERIHQLLEQPLLEQKSTNTGNMQSVKTIPLNWFHEY